MKALLLKKNKLINICLIALIVFDLWFVYYNLVHGIGYGDAVYPISLCHNIINGNMPLVDSWTCYPGFIFLAPIIYIYKFVNKGYEGIVLFYKIVYYVLIILNICVFYKLINLKSKDNKLINLSISVLINSFVFISWGGLSYSYIFIIINMYCTFIVYVYNDIYINKITLSIIFAILMFVMTMFYPTAFIIAIAWTLIVYIKNFNSNDKFLIVNSYIFTGVILSIMYLLFLLFYARGYQPIFKSIYSIFNLPHNKWKVDISISIVNNFRSYWKYIIILLIVFCVLVIIGNRFNKNNKPIVMDSYYFIYMFLILSFVYYYSSDQQNFILTILMTFSFFSAFCLLFINDNICFLRYISVILCFIIIPFYIWFVAPKYLGSTPNYKNDTYIDYGIYKGLYTNKDDYKFITNIEKDLKDYFENNKSEICEVTVFPATYLMTDAKVIAPDTWDSMELHVANIDSWVIERNIQIPIPDYPLTDYFAYIMKKPKYIVSVDYYVRDFKNNTGKYEINNFLNEYYYVDYEKEYNLSRLIVYKIKK